MTEPEIVHTFVSHSASEWQLYDAPGAEAAAEAVNEIVNRGVTQAFLAMARGKPPRDAIGDLQQLDEALTSYASVGSHDGDTA